MASFPFPVSRIDDEKAAAVVCGNNRFYYRQAFEYSKEASSFFQFKAVFSSAPTMEQYIEEGKNTGFRACEYSRARR
jgi:hypothetical protein